MIFTFLRGILTFLFVLFTFLPLYAGNVRATQKIVFAEERIEGKIRRPQLVLIQAELRPTFTPMVMQSLKGGKSVVEFVSESAIEGGVYSQAFKFNGTEISNYTR